MSFTFFYHPEIINDLRISKPFGEQTTEWDLHKTLHDENKSLHYLFPKIIDTNKWRRSILSLTDFYPV